MRKYVSVVRLVILILVNRHDGIGSIGCRGIICLMHITHQHDGIVIDGGTIGKFTIHFHRFTCIPYRGIYLLGVTINDFITTITCLHTHVFNSIGTITVRICHIIPFICYICCRCPVRLDGDTCHTIGHIIIGTL